MLNQTSHCLSIRCLLSFASINEVLDKVVLEYCFINNVTYVSLILSGGALSVKVS